MSYPQYGIYLIPSPAITYQMGVGHHLLASEFNVRTGGRFMVHCTVKGFFRLKEGTAPDDFLPQLDELMARTPTFPTRVTELYIHNGNPGTAFVILDRTPAFHSLHNEIFELVQPLISPEDHFTPNEWAGPKFTPHLTLAMSDLPTDAGLREQVYDLCRFVYEGLPRETFTARSMQLIEFQSDDWAGRWWETLSYRQLKGWQLPDPTTSTN